VVSDGTNQAEPGLPVDEPGVPDVVVDGEDEIDGVDEDGEPIVPPVVESPVIDPDTDVIDPVVPSAVPIVDSSSSGVVNTNAPVIVDDNDGGRMPFEEAQRIFVPIIVIFTAIAIALSVGYIIKAGKTPQAIKYGCIFIAVALVIFLIAFLVFYGVYGKL